MKRILTLFICLSLLLTFVGCNDTSKPTEVPSEIPTEAPTQSPTEAPTESVKPEPLPDKLIFENDLYRYERIDGKCYITAKVELKEEPILGSFSDDMIVMPTYASSPFKYIIEFDSFCKLYLAVTQDGLTLEELSKIFWNYGNLDIPTMIEVMDFERMYIPTLPEGIELDKVQWTGQNYVVQLFSKKGWSGVACNLNGRAAFEEDINSIRVKDGETGVVTSTYSETSDGIEKTIIEWNRKELFDGGIGTKNYKQEEFVIYKNSSPIKVFANYDLEDTESVNPTFVPRETVLYLETEDPESFLMIDISTKTLKRSYTKDWLLEFGSKLF